MKIVALLIIALLLAAWPILGTVTFSLLAISVLFIAMSLLPLLQARANA